VVAVATAGGIIDDPSNSIQLVNQKRGAHLLQCTANEPAKQQDGDYWLGRVPALLAADLCLQTSVGVEDNSSRAIIVKLSFHSELLVSMFNQDD
jgi:hypothetical protein